VTAAALDFNPTGGDASDCVEFETSLDIGPNSQPRLAATDKGYDSPRIAMLRAYDITPVIPAAKPPRTVGASSGSTRPERGSSRRPASSNASGVSLRYARKTAASFSAVVSIACALVLVKSVRRPYRGSAPLFTFP
jgi:hypothetical protein